MSYLIMTVGKTHSGKTTFGKKLAQKIKNSILIDTDEIAGFLKDNYVNLYNTDFLKNSNQLSPGYFLKKEIANTIFKSTFKTDLLIISTSANSTKKLRKGLLNLARKNGRKVIMIYFNLPEKILLDRINKSNKSKKCLYHSKNFKDLLLNKQSIRFEGANEKEADYFFEINKVINADKVFDEVLKLLKG
jgi:predicted kinase